MRALGLIIMCSFISACSIFGGGDDNVEVVFDDTLGPNSELLSKQLPGTLQGDTENASYSGRSEPADLKKDKPE